MPSVNFIHFALKRIRTKATTEYYIKCLIGYLTFNLLFVLCCASNVQKGIRRLFEVCWWCVKLLRGMCCLRKGNVHAENGQENEEEVEIRKIFLRFSHWYIFMATFSILWYRGKHKGSSGWGLGIRIGGNSGQQQAQTRILSR